MSNMKYLLSYECLLTVFNRLSKCVLWRWCTKYKYWGVRRPWFWKTFVFIVPTRVAVCFLICRSTRKEWEDEETVISMGRRKLLEAVTQFMTIQFLRRLVLKIWVTPLRKWNCVYRWKKNRQAIRREKREVEERRREKREELELRFWVEITLWSRRKGERGTKKARRT